MAMKSDNLCAIIPVRAGSKRVPNKNIRPFAGVNLLEIKIRQLNMVFSKENIFVSTDCSECANAASALGVNVQWRPAEFASDTVSMSDVYRYLAESVPHEHVLFTHVTNPMCDAAELREAITAYDNLLPGEFDSLTTVTQVKDFMYWPDSKPLNFDPLNKPRSQDLPAIFKLNHAISILPRALMIEQKNIVGKNPFWMQISNLAATDIDTFLDFQVAEFLYNWQHTLHP